MTETKRSLSTPSLYERVRSTIVTIAGGILTPFFPQYGPDFIPGMSGDGKQSKRELPLNSKTNH